MLEKQPILSLCIPTYNRAEILRDTLSHYVSCKEFNAEVELVISDNASDDTTQAVCEEFCGKYANIHYYRNPENIRDANFAVVLDLAKGKYRKLMNDTIYMPNEALRAMKSHIRANSQTETPIFFVTGPVYERIKTHEYTCSSVDEYVQKVSLFVTAISLFGTWNTDWDKITNKRQFAQLKLNQVDWTYQIISKKNTCKLIYLEPYWLLSNGASQKKSESYNFFQVHLTNYNAIKKVYVDRGLISPQTMRKDGHVFLQHYRKQIWRSLFARNNDAFEYSQTMQLLLNTYSFDPYFYMYMVSFPLWYMEDIARRIKNRIMK